MATPYPGMDPEYLKSLQAMIAAMGPSATDKDAAKYQGLLAMGLGLMGARKGQEFAAAGNAGLLGLDARNRSLAQATAEKGAGLNQALNAQQLQGAMQAQADDAGYRKAMQDRYSPAAQPQTPNAMAQAYATGTAVPNQSAVPAERLSTNKLSDYEKAIQDAQYLEAKGVAPKYVEAAYAKAEKLRPKIKETRAVVDPTTGQRVLANIYEDGRIEIQKGAAPDLEKLHFQDTGGGYAGLNPFTGAPAPGATGVKTQSADSKATNALGWARFNEEKRRAADTQAKPQWDSASGQFVIAPTAANPTGSAVSPAGFNKPEKPLTESQAKATAYVNQMENANSDLAKLEKAGFTGKGAFQQGQIINAGSDGIPFVPGSGTITRGLGASDNAQKFHNAQLQWTEPVLRFLTGANAPKEEVIRNAATFFPRPGDSDEVIAQKANARAAMEQSLRLAAGTGSTKVPGQKKDIRSEADRILAGGN